MSDLGAEVAAATGDDLDTFAKFIEGGGFFDKSMCADLKEFTDEAGGLVAGEDEDAGVGQFLGEATKDIGAVHVGKHDVKDDEVGLQFEAAVATFFTVAGFNDDVVIITVENGLSNEFADRGLVFDNGYAFHNGWYGVI